MCVCVCACVCVFLVRARPRERAYVCVCVCLCVCVRVLLFIQPKGRSVARSNRGPGRIPPVTSEIWAQAPELRDRNACVAADRWADMCLRVMCDV